MPCGCSKKCRPCWALTIAVTSVAAYVSLSAQEPRSLDAIALQQVEQLLLDGAYSLAETAAERLSFNGINLNDRDYRESVLLEVRIRNGRSSSPDTLALAQSLAATLDNDSTPRDERLALLLRLARFRLDRGEFVLARRIAEKAVDLATNNRADPDMIVAALNLSAEILMATDRHLDARRRLDLSLRLIGSPDERPGLYAHTLGLVALLHRLDGNYGAATDAVELAETTQRATAPGHPELAALMLTKGDLLYLQGGVSEAAENWQEALAIAQRNLQSEHPLIVTLRHRLYLPLKASGDILGAKRVLERTAVVAERALARCNAELTDILGALALTEAQNGEYREADALYGRVTNIQRQCLGSANSNSATMIHNRGLLAAEMGDTLRAERLQREAIRIWSGVLGADHPYVARGIDALAEVHASQGRFASARYLYERALKIRTAQLGAMHPDVAWTLSNLAKTLLRSGNSQAASDLIDRAIQIYRLGGVPQEPDHFARVLALQGDVRASRSEFVQARTSYAEAFEIRERVFGAEHPLTASSRVDVARADFALDETGPAVNGTLEAERIARDHVQFTIRYLPERQAMAYAAARPHGLDLALSVAANDQATDPKRILDSVAHSRGLLLDEMAARARSASADSDSQILSLNTVMLNARQRFAALMLRSFQGEEPVSSSLLEQTRQEKEDAERALAERSVAAREEARRAQMGLDDVRRAMPAGSALVSFVRYDRTSFVTRSSGRAMTTTPSYIALVTRADSVDVNVIPLGTAASIERLINAWRAEAGGRAIAAGVEAREAERTYRTAGTALRAGIWDPLADSIKGASRVFIVPDGALNLVSFAALPTGSRYLLETGPTIHYLSTERDLVRTTGPEGRGLLALGGPAFDTRTSAGNGGTALRAGCGAIGSLRFEDLPGSRAEAQDIARIWGDPADVLVLSGRAATKTALTRVISGRKVVHLATHGFFLGSDCDTAVPRTRGVGGIVNAAAVPVENPLLLSGLALAGVNTLSGARQANGILNAEEIAGLNLQGTEWAVLSACDTGLGQIAAGEGVFGLRRALQIAGVHTIIMSLWSVEDQSTRDWMKALYTARLSRRLDTPDSVRAASIQLLEQRRKGNLSTHPFYWAAFVAAGDWR